MKKTIILDFDGTLYSYVSGWLGMITLPDLPTEGALRFLMQAVNHYQVAVFSSRSRSWFGRWAMRRWLFKHVLQHFRLDVSQPTRTARVRARKLVKQIQFPKHKPPAFLSIDDRAVPFRGQWPDLSNNMAKMLWENSVFGVGTLTKLELN